MPLQGAFTSAREEPLHKPPACKGMRRAARLSTCESQIDVAQQPEVRAPIDLTDELHSSSIKYKVLRGGDHKGVLCEAIHARGDHEIYGAIGRGICQIKYQLAPCRYAGWSDQPPAPASSSRILPWTMPDLQIAAAAAQIHCRPQGTWAQLSRMLGGLVPNWHHNSDRSE